MPRRPRAALGALVAVLAGCSSDPETTPGPGADPPAPACDVHATLGPAQLVNRSAEWGLEDVRGGAVSAADLNGDGYPDLIVHWAHANTRQVVGGEPYYRLMMNEPRPGGGRVFVDRTADSGFGATPEGSTTEYRAAQTAIFGDVDNDGDLDVFSGTWSEPPQNPPTLGDLDRSHILLNDGTAHFTLAPDSDVQTPAAKRLGGATFVDADRDGWLDLFLGYWFEGAGYAIVSPMLLRGEPGAPGVFNEVTALAGLADGAHQRPSFGVAACDLDDDGLPELVAGAYGRLPNLLLRNDGTGWFSDIAAEAGYGHDDVNTYDDDQAYLCYCEDKPTDPYCAGAAPPMVASCNGLPNWIPNVSDQPDRLGGNTFTTLCADLTGDGLLDLYATQIVHWWAGVGSDPSELLVQTGEPGPIRFTRPGRDVTGIDLPRVGTSWNEGGLYGGVGDVDNDGRTDLVIGASDYPDQWGLYFRRQANGSFVELAETSGWHQPCVATPLLVDVDRDGDLDLITASSQMREWCTDQYPDGPEVQLHESNASTLGHWLIVKLVGNGTTANQAAIGARVRLRTEDGLGEETVQLQELGGGYGHGSMHPDTVLYFGLGGCAAIHSIEVTWPDLGRSVDQYDNVTANQFVELRQGDPTAHPVAL